MLKKIIHFEVLLIVIVMASSTALAQAGISTHFMSGNTLVGSYEPVYTVDLDLPHLERWK